MSHIWTRIAGSVAILVGMAMLVHPAPAQEQNRCFPETGYCINGRIRAYWEQNGGLPVLGFPTGPQQEEFIEGQNIQAQWFERNRLELHPENAAPNDVLLGRLGADRLAQQGRDWKEFPRGAAQDGCRSFAETGHALCGAVLAYWQSHGLNQDGDPGVGEGESLALFGLPLSDAVSETLGDGKQYSVQYFERARFELHPEIGTNTVLLGLLGKELRPFSAVLVDRTQDFEGVGYPDQRKIVRDSHGNLYIPYRKKLDNQYRIFVARSTNGGANWSVLNNNQPIEQVGSYPQRNPAIAIDAADTLHVVWYGSDARSNDENERQIKYARSRDGGATWSAWVNLAEVPGYANQKRWQEHPSLYVQGTTISVVWEGFDQTSENEEQVKIARSTDSGQTWSAWQSVAPEPNRSHSRPAFVATSDGSRLFILAYGERGKEKQIIWTTSTDGGVSWAAWAPIASSSTEQREVSVAIDSANHLHAVWQQPQANGKPQILYATSDGATWSAPTAIAPTSAASQFYPSIAVVGQNKLAVVWTESNRGKDGAADDPEAGRILVSLQSPGRAWSTSTLISPYGSTGMYASLRWGSLNNGGTIDVVWMDMSDTENRRIRYTALGAW